MRPSPVIDALPCRKAKGNTRCARDGAARNIESTLLRRRLTPFVYSTRGQLATIGRHTGVAEVCGVKFSGFAAWWLWRTVYLMKLPRLSKKLRVVLAWTLVAVDGLSDAERGEEASVKAWREAVDHTPEPTARRSALRFDAATLARLRDVTRGPTSPPTTW